MRNGLACGSSGTGKIKDRDKFNNFISNYTANGGSNSEKNNAELQHLKIVVLGAPKVGKTCLVQQFVNCHFPENYVSTTKPETYHPAITVNDHVYNARVVDCPTLSYFPTNSLQEWTDFRGFGLRSASGYVLVFDVTSDSTFKYIKDIRAQIQEQNIDAPILIAGNKVDLLNNGKDKKEAKKEAGNIVKKQWKCLYVECSAKYNWHINSAFKELLKAIDHKDYGHKPATARVQAAFRRNQCRIM